MEKLATTQYPIHDPLQRRWSPRAFSDQLIDDETITKLFEAARWSASWRNVQPWRFIMATRDKAEEFQKLFDCLMPGNQKWAEKAALLVAVTAQGSYDPGADPNPITYYDAGQAVANLVVEATANGLFAHQMGGINRDKIRETYQIPAEYNVITAIAVGYMGQVEDLPEDLQPQERQPRVRKPLHEFVFSGSWESPANLDK